LLELISSWFNVLNHGDVTFATKEAIVDVMDASVDVAATDAVKF